MAVVNLMDVYLGASKSPRKSLAQATELQLKAIDLDKNYDSAYSVLGHIYGMQRQYEKAVELGQKAIELNPNSDEAYVWLAMTLNCEMNLQMYPFDSQRCSFKLQSCK